MVYFVVCAQMAIVNQQKKIAFIASCLGMLVFGITIVTLGSVAPALKQRFLLDDLEIGTLFSILPVGLILGSLIIGPVCDRRGYKEMMLIAAVGIGIGFEGIAYVKDLTFLRLFVLLFGISAGFINGATNSIVVDISDEHKGPNLSILGIFFGVGALGMPLILSRFLGKVPELTILSIVGLLILLFGLVFLVVPFPPSKHEQGTTIPWKSLFSPLLLLISFYLFFQSSVESIITNWTTTYIGSKGFISKSQALVGLSVHMMGIIAMRFVSASVFRNRTQTAILWICLGQLLAGILLMHHGQSVILVFAGLFLSGAGVSAGFPVMLGMVGQNFPSISATAISFVFVIALLGNMLINYFTGLFIQRYGISYLLPVIYSCMAAMGILFYLTYHRLKNKPKTKV